MKMLKRSTGKKEKGSWGNVLLLKDVHKLALTVVQHALYPYTAMLFLKTAVTLSFSLSFQLFVFERLPAFYIE